MPVTGATSELEWLRTASLVPYPEAVAAMEARVSAILAQEAPEAVWLLEHPPLYTAGTSASPEELLEPTRLPVFVSGRGGRLTYHGPGQRVAYMMLDLGRRDRRDVRAFVHDLESLGVEASRSVDEIGVFAGEAKIASIGIRLRRWVSFHGVSLNVSPDLSHFNGIVPCGRAKTRVTSLAAIGAETSMDRVDEALRTAFEAVFPA
jgi:lipoyl(octanoyl) transferase